MAELEIVKFFGRPGGEVVVTVETPFPVLLSGLGLAIAQALEAEREAIREHAVDRHGLVAITVRAKLAGMFYGYRVRFTPSMLSFPDELGNLLAAGLREEVLALASVVQPEAWSAIQEEAFTHA